MKSMSSPFCTMALWGRVMDLSCFSFSPLTCNGQGLAAQADDAAADRVKILEFQGRESDGAGFVERHRDLDANGPGQGKGIVCVFLGNLGRVDLNTIRRFDRSAG